MIFEQLVNCIPVIPYDLTFNGETIMLGFPDEKESKTYNPNCIHLFLVGEKKKH